MMAATVYAVTRGQYSDYRIVAIFSTKEAAQLLVAEINDPESGCSYDEASVEEYPIDCYLSEMERGYHRYFVRLSVGGYVTECHRNPPSYQGDGDGRDIHGGFFFGCWAKDEKAAIKIAKDRRAQAIAIPGAQR